MMHCAPLEPLAKAYELSTRQIISSVIKVTSSDVCSVLRYYLVMLTAVRTEAFV